MKKRIIFVGVGVLVLLVALGGLWVWKMAPEKNPYEGLVTALEVTISEEARAEYEAKVVEARAKVAAWDPSTPFEHAVYFDLASNALKLGDLVAAREAYETVLEQNNADIATWINYGRVLMQMQDYQGAEEAFRKVMQLGGGSEASIRDLYDAVLKQNVDGARTEELKRILEAGVTGAGQTPWLMIALGDWYKEAGDCVRAKDHYEVAKSLVEADSQKEMVAQAIEDLKGACE